jgi:hypothetical protein
MADVIKLKGTSIVISNTTPNTVNSASLVRLNHAGTGTTAVAVNVANSGGVYASVWINPQTYVFIQKQPSDTVASNTTTSDITAVSIAYS